MQIKVTAPSLTKPTYQTLEEYSIRRLKKIEKLLRKKDQTEYEIRVSVEKSRDLFRAIIEVFGPSNAIVKADDRDLRKVIDIAVDQLKRVLANKNDKIQRVRKRDRVMNKLRSIRERIPF